MNKRIEMFDLLKVWCMLLVIIVHTLNNSYGDVGMEAIRFFCLCYTMPMFAFISGWFSNEKSDIKKNIKRLLLPCIVMTIVNDGIMYAVNPRFHIHVFTLFTPGFAMWYLWALFVFRSILPYIVRIPHVILLSFILSWVVGFIPQINSVLSASRIFCFLPYFLLGHKIAKDIALSKIRVNVMKPLNIHMGGVMLLVIFILWCTFIINHPGHTYATGFNSGFGLSIKGLSMRIALQLTILFTGYIVIRMTPDRNSRFSVYGDRTMNVYLLHSLVVLPFAYLIFPPFGEATIIQKILMIVIPTSICMLFFTRPVDSLMKRLLR